LGIYGSTIPYFIYKNKECINSTALKPSIKLSRSKVIMKKEEMHTLVDQYWKWLDEMDSKSDLFAEEARNRYINARERFVSLIGTWQDEAEENLDNLTEQFKSAWAEVLEAFNENDKE